MWMKEKVLKMTMKRKLGEKIDNDKQDMEMDSKESNQ